MVFEKPGPQNTEKTIDIAIEAARERGIRHIVVASTKGDTGVLCARKLKGTGINLVVVSHNAGFKTPGVLEFDAEAKRKLSLLVELSIRGRWF